ncbi:D-tyrosyl-tRNA(Tyr) deacylase [Pleurocapsales cyanobacterium LEGE 06147]|nr:D-tyrosyl-tRNA(Tyr) deacylase [Pleurocapsales cyanobacterium LEGE 06147]
MRVVIQRVKSSFVTVDGEIVGKIGRGLNLLVGIASTDTDTELDWMARKCLELRLFPEKSGGDPAQRVLPHRWEKSVREIDGELLVISQFTLYGDCRKGRRPSFSDSASPDIAESLYERFIAKLKQSGLRVETGKFGAMMQVSIENDGPVTLLLEKEAFV